VSTKILTKMTVLAVASAFAIGGCAVGSSDGGQSGDKLVLGSLLPLTGPISSLGAPQVAALKLAAADINAAGGSHGMKVSFTGGDEAGDPAVAGQAVDRLIADKVPAIMGAGSSAISLSVIDKITGARRVQCSGMNTSPELSSYPDDGYYFRTVPPDTLQGAVLAKRIAGDGAGTVAIIARSDSYATGIANNTESSLKAEGVKVLKRVNYDPTSQNLEAEVRQIAATKADAVVIFAFDEGAKILQGLIQDGAGPSTTKLYGTDALPIATLAKSVDKSDPGVLKGMTFTQASSGEGSPFTTRLLKTSPKLKTTAFTPYFYDCAILTALAIDKADSSDPTKFAKEMVGLTNGTTECTTYKECKKLIADGTSIAYAGAAGPLKFSDVGEPTTGLYDVLNMQEDGTTKVVDTVRQGAK
jgi:ABC-type branched-subunit amino acid transport system substrate-binding protein